MDVRTSPKYVSNILDYTLCLASSSRLFVAAQIARHPDLSWRSQPVKRASEFLHSHEDLFEVLEVGANKPRLYRLSAKARRLFNVEAKPVSARSMKARHWVELGDVWSSLALFLVNERKPKSLPTKWITEWNRQFDVYCEWMGKPYLIEYQRTPITSRQWSNKWALRKKWYSEQKWQEKPRVVLVVTTGQQDDTIQAPRGTIVVRRMEDLPRMLIRGSP